MSKMRLVYMWSLRNAAADRAGQKVAYKGGQRYMKSPLQYLAELLDATPLGERYSLEAVISDDDPDSDRDCDKLAGYGFTCGEGEHWFYPPQLTVQGRRMEGLRYAVPSSYRRLPPGDAGRVAGKRDYEQRVLEMLREVKADLVLLDGLLIILDELVRPGSPFHRRIVNIHPGITRIDSPYERRGAYATLDALHGARGERKNWQTGEVVAVPPVSMTGASFHYVDNGIDSGEVITDVLATPIDPADTILELRWNNFNNSLFPAMRRGLEILAGMDVGVTWRVEERG
ncbi:N(5)-hydroxyornithine transformylase PvdF [Azoarcus sp. TTM-91]|uniref:formyltransferase family protein n=1 Tax=Azoarcus sp. TTM-91 TaxID=2691581 RepID=UPI00145D737F|nr:formyltransferase family protein [Azoarcus sp. TTM-91]NMG37013.1 N(5)-hydroxyornithine transformylase PvdF [Azoarcus sp. TTM-91]